MLRRFHYVMKKLHLFPVIWRNSRRKNYLTLFLVSHLIITSLDRGLRIIQSLNPRMLLIAYLSLIDLQILEFHAL